MASATVQTERCWSSGAAMVSNFVNKALTWIILYLRRFHPLKRIKPVSLAASLALVASLGCNRDQVQTTRLEKSDKSALMALPPGHPPMSMPPSSMQTNEPLPPPEVNQALKWTLPKGWTSAPAGGMRYATLKPPAQGNAEVSVVMFSGPAGGELANVNRWRTQLGLPPIEAAALASARKTVKSKAGVVGVFDFNNAGNRMVVGQLATPDGNTWFFKLVGEVAPVSQALPDFMKLLGTLTLG